ncbi:uncharacterized protein LOC117751631 [Cyclopterus lumpus]|uniref:uncharacterized protein LOC117751631 n=1 Tax=Cyclopterus lumpus TaxID=8103 RepID=UPI00148611B5|nr:uncharacterized protein LOC117751631 [Cyclopterus lumpus]XP_034419455.1 uncharacterized protein LOC117751631 [Cyclopterus lumpus]
MGSGTSRGKKVAPACVSEVKVTKTTAGVTPSEQDSRPFKPLQIHAMLRNARNRAQPDCHSEGHDSDCSREDDDIEGEMDTFLTDCKERGKAATRRPKKTALRSKTYGLCRHFSQEDDEDLGSAPRSPVEEPRGGSGDVNKRSGDSFTPVCPSQRSSSSRGCLTRGAFLEAVPTSEKQSACGSAMPLILYDGSEEELMDTIEKEFS